MMYSLYYVNPETQNWYPCTSSRHMDFSSDADVSPVLFAKKENVEKALRDYKRCAVEGYFEKNVTSARRRDWLIKIRGQYLNISGPPGSEF